MTLLPAIEQSNSLFLDKNNRGHDDHESSYVRTGLPSHGVPSDGISGSSFTVEPAADDDETEDIYFSVRHMAGARFQRNQRLIAEIFNEICIPDLRSNVNVDRISTLRRQVDALNTHRDTFEKDLNDLEEKHAAKKQKFIETNEKFHSEYAEASATNLSREKIDEILQKYETMERLQKEKQLLLQQQQQQQQLQQTTAVPPPSQPTSVTATIPTTTVSESSVPTTTKTEPEPPTEVPQEQTTTSPPSVQPSLPPPQPVPSPVPTSQAISSPLPPSQTCFYSITTNTASSTSFTSFSACTTSLTTTVHHATNATTTAAAAIASTSNNSRLSCDALGRWLCTWT